MISTLLLFDIDGTLIQTGAGRVAFGRAFERAYGITDAATTIPMAGRTDPEIFREICTAFDLDPATFGAWKIAFLGELAEALMADPGRCLPGVVNLLELCVREPGFFLILGTGNVEEGARLKLAAHGLNRYFATGGFGADGATRREVIARGIERAQMIHGGTFERRVVIGDTPLDIQCGKANGCLTVGVATGRHGPAELKSAGADLVLSSFADTEQVMIGLRTLGSGFGSFHGPVHTGL